MLHFDCDYMEGAHPQVLQRLTDTNMEQTPGYGQDAYTREACEKIREACGCPQALVSLLVGGTQTNATVIDALLHTYEGVLAAESGHISQHEAGAVEASGHKVLTLPQHEGKVSAGDLQDYLNTFYKDEAYPHMVIPGALYISYPTEYGTLYSLNELEALSRVCRENGLLLYLDGARLGYGLVASADVTLRDIARLCDVFYIGGTKVGALMGEAVVAPCPELLPHFFTHVKRHGAVLAKGRLLGLQFAELFTDGLYLKIAKNAVETALKLKQAMVEKGYRLYIDSPTNQQFFYLNQSDIERLRRYCTFEIWATVDQQQSIVRFVTSWATRQEDIDELIRQL
ncbi:MAG: low specificity L-threonine aldolase [Bacteroidales bacterium]|nr:low specificity L-threonine aldolase [Bacteroidales bacterium]